MSGIAYRRVIDSLRAIDGLRALAIVPVLLFYFGVSLVTRNM